MRIPAPSPWILGIARTIWAIVFPLISLGVAEAQFGPAKVIVSEVISRPVAEMQSFVATVMPLRKSIVGTAVDGRIISFLFDAKDPETKLTYVTKNTPLASLRSRTIEIKIAEATAQRDLRQAEWNEASQKQPGLIQKAESVFKAAQENFQYSKNQYQRRRQLYETNRTISLDEFELARNQMYTAEQSYIEAKIEVSHLKREDHIKQAKARLDQSEAVLSELNHQLKNHTILAPFDGFVVVEHTEQGQWVRQGDPIATVVQLHPVEVRAFVPEAYAGYLVPNNMATEPPKVKHGETLTFGRITGVIAEAANRTRTFAVKIQVDNPQYRLKAGMLAEVELEVGERAPRTLVPKDALVLGGPTPRIFLAVPDPTDPSKSIAKMLPVRYGVSLDSWIVVSAIGDEIVPGDLVVEKGNERLRPGAPLLVDRKGATPPPVNRKGATPPPEN